MFVYNLDILIYIFKYLYMEYLSIYMEYAYISAYTYIV